MTENLLKRIFTSIILSTVLLICVFLNKYTWLILIIFTSIFSFFEFNDLLKKILKNKGYLRTSFNIVSLFYLLLFIYLSNQLYNLGLELTLFILLVCIFSDIGGYIFGKTIGGKKLTKISPNKTIAGSIGSFLLSSLPILIFYIYDKNEYPIKINMFLITLLISFICQTGDLLISYFKRKAKVKDTGALLPGHGGILDRIDGILFGLPFGTLLLFFR